MSSDSAYKIEDLPPLTEATTTAKRRTEVQGGGSSIGGRRTHTVYPTKYLLVTGELTTGFDFYGPFDSVEKAGRWATDNLKAGEFHRVHNMHEVRDSK